MEVGLRGLAEGGEEALGAFLAEARRADRADEELLGFRAGNEGVWSLCLVEAAGGTNADPFALCFSTAFSFSYLSIFY